MGLMSYARAMATPVVPRRSALVVALGALLFGLSVSAAAQPAPGVPRIGLQVVSPRDLNVTRIEAFRHGLHELGYIEGKNLSIEYRYAEGRLDLLPALAAELVQQQVDVIVTVGTPGVLAAKNATGTIPIVFVSVSDPVANGVVASLARPGGNVTGLSILAPELSRKRLELLKDAFPHVTRVLVLWNPDVQWRVAVVLGNAGRREGVGRPAPLHGGTGRERCSRVDSSGHEGPEFKP
jgi:putative tryptophan/tyrosine transport system substrate-binding protein